MTAPVVEVRNVVKTYPLYAKVGFDIKSIVLHPWRLKYLLKRNRHLVLDDISFSINKGCSLGIMGKNGAGKSTILSLLAGVLKPDSGSVKVSGRKACMLQLGSGFHPELTGVENIKLNAALIGLSQAEVKEKFESIIEFAALDDFINEPLRVYSSGMKARLGFAVIAHTDPELLIIDEVLAVGDADFRKKCSNKVLELKQRGVTIILVSHSTGDIKNICDTAMVLEKGKIKKTGSVEECLSVY